MTTQPPSAAPARAQAAAAQPTPAPASATPSSTGPSSTSPSSTGPAVRPEAVLWDFDGTLVDSEPIWMRAQFDLVPQWGGVWTDEHAHQLVGNSLITSGRYIVDVIGRDDLDPHWVVDQLITRVVQDLRTEPIDWRPGALELLAGLRAAGIPCALVSASYRILLEAALEQLPAGTFTEVVAGDEVERGKPDPEPYLLASRRLGVDPQDTLVLEDSRPGCASGNAAGAVVLGIHNMVDLPPAPQRVLVDSLAGLGVAEVSALYADARREPLPVASGGDPR